MRIKAVCKTHPMADVLLRIGTVQFMKNETGEYCDEYEEKAIGIELDEGNTYCTIKTTDRPHDISFEVLP